MVAHANVSSCVCINEIGLIPLQSTSIDLYWAVARVLKWVHQIIRRMGNQIQGKPGIYLNSPYLGGTVNQPECFALYCGAFNGASLFEL